MLAAVPHPTFQVIPSAHLAAMDNPDTIDPAALNAPATTISPNLLSRPSPRGVKRARTPDPYDDTNGQDVAPDDVKSIKRSRTLKLSSSTSQTMPLTIPPHAVQTPQIATQSLPHGSPIQTSPQQSTPGSATRPTVVKALPTVRDHTTDQLGPEGDEYLPREIDEAGETKVTKTGHPLDGRKYKCRTFTLPNRGDKLFMLATECARVLGYRDSYLLFNKNRSLYKIIASQPEKDNLIHKEILPYSYRSRQIAIVTARSMFRQFGSRLIEGGRRVRDDYWVAKAIKQGFTDADMAGDKRPGASKRREADAAAAARNVVTALPQGDIIYTNGPGLDAHPPGPHTMTLAPTAPLPMIHLAGDELSTSTFGNIMRPRQEITGPAYQDRTQSSGASEILTQAAGAAEYNKQLSQTRAHRSKYLDDYWRRPHEQPASQADPPPSDMTTVAPQQLQSPQAVAGMNQPRGIPDPSSHPGSQMIPQTYGAYPNQQNPAASPTQVMNRPLPPSQMPQGSPLMHMGAAAGTRQTPTYSYGGGQMWQPPPPQPSPLSQQHPMQYGQQQTHQSPMPPPQMPPQPGMNYNQMNQMGAGAYNAMNRSMYQPSPSPQQFNMTQLPVAGQPSGMQGWTNPTTMPSDWQPRYQ